MKKISLIVLFFACFCPVLWAQNATQADRLFLDGDYKAAYQLYSKLYAASPKNTLYTYRLARCEQELGMNAEAITHFEKAGDKYKLRNLYLGDLYFLDYRFAEAKEMYEAYLESIDESHERYPVVTEQIRRTERALRYYNRIEDIAIIDSVCFPKEQLMHYVQLSPEEGSLTEKDGIYTFENQRGDRRYMVLPTSDHRSVICRQERLLDTWSEPDTLPEVINQFSQQGYPFLLTDGLTLYFSASSGNGLGGWDIYVTRYNSANNTWLQPEALGMPFNSTEGDYLLYMDESAGKGYFVTDRNSAPGYLTRYTFLPNESKRLLRDSADAYVRDYARLRVLRMPQQEEEETDIRIAEETETTEVPQQPVNDFELVVTDQLTITSLEQISNPDTRALVEQYLDLEEQIAEESADLQTQRTAYQRADADKATLKPLILVLEKDVARLKRESAQLLQKIRSLF